VVVGRWREGEERVVTCGGCGAAPRGALETRM